MKYFFETYGCQMNKAESAAIEQIFMNRGWQDAGNAEEADFIVINTCSVRATAESRIAGRLGWFTTLRRERQKAGTGDFTLVVTGCMAERLKDDLKKQFKVVDYVVGTFQRQHFTELIEAAEKKTRIEYMDEEPVYSFAPLSYEKGTFQAYVPIMHGCNNFCTYCIVPYVRGREVSRNPDEILKELDMLSERGVREITLLGQNVNSYMWKTGDGKGDKKDDGSFIDFPALMQLIADHLKETSSSIGWVRFMSSHPKDISERLIDVIAKERVMCRHIHLPVQHGSTRILQAMNRRYTASQYAEFAAEARRLMPDIHLGTDVIVGFPGETEEEFEESRRFIASVGFISARSLRRIQMREL